MFHHKSFLREEEVETEIATASMNGGQLAQARADGGIAWASTAVAHRCAVNPKHRTRPPFAYVKRFLKMSDGRAPGGGRHHFLN